MAVKTDSKISYYLNFC